LFNIYHADNELEGTFAYKNDETWARKKLPASKKLINDIERIMFFYNKGCMN
jgi:hypothetical protein